MQYSKLIRYATLALAVAFGAIPFVWAKKPERQSDGRGYAIVPFVPPGSQSSSSGVIDLNDQWQAVGWVEIADGESEATHLDIVTGVYTSLQNGADATGVNNLNQIVGSDGISGLFWDSPSASPVDLPPLPGDLESWPWRINDAGIIIGSSGDVDLTVGVVWRVVVDSDGTVHGDGPIPLPPLVADAEIWVADINELVGGSAQVVGRSARKAVLWTIELNPDGTLAMPAPPVPLGTLGSWSQSGGINNFVDVCGGSDERPFVASASEALQPLPVPRNTLDGMATDINDAMEIVGYVELPVKGSNTFNGIRYAQLWKNGELIDLSKQIPRKSGWDRLTWAMVINNDGVIGGWGEFDVNRRGFLLIPNEL